MQLNAYTIMALDMYLKYFWGISNKFICWHESTMKAIVDTGD